MGTRTRRDIEAGRPVFLAQLREKKRNRAAEHRKSRGAERAQDRIQKEREWHRAFDDPEQRPKATDWVDRAKTYNGIEDDIEPEPDIERRSLNKLETTAFLTEPPKQVLVHVKHPCREVGASQHMRGRREWIRRSDREIRDERRED